MMLIVPEPEWQHIFNEISPTKATSIIIGATDSGKSTLARYLINSFVSQGIPVCFIDSDIGQSSIGVPGVITSKVFSTIEDISNFSFETLCFVGTINPAKNISCVIDCTKRLSDTCSKSAHSIVVDTSGLISGEAGLILKTGKIRSLNPNFIIALQKQEELEHLLHSLSGYTVFRINISTQVKPRSIASRTHYRKRKFDQYFNTKDSSDFLMQTKEVLFFDKTRIVRPAEVKSKFGNLVGLNHNDNTIALGILDEFTETYFTFKSPIKSVREINKVLLGDITI